MASTRSKAIRILISLGLGLFLVATPLELAFLVVFIWPVLVFGWMERQTRSGSWRAGLRELSLQLFLMSSIVAAGIWAACKYEDQFRTWRIGLPNPVMSINEMRTAHGMTARFPYRRWVRFPDDFPNTTIRFPSRNLSMVEFIQAIEGQTPLRRNLIRGCANGSTILWGGNGAHGAYFEVPSP